MQRYIIDLHCHTIEYSYDGKVTGADIVKRLLVQGFSGVIFTDHNNVWPDDELDELRHELELPENFLLLSGQEVRTHLGDLVCGDVLVYGPKEPIPDGTQISDVLQIAKDAKGFCIAAHPGVPTIGLGERVGDFPLVAGEAWNGRYGPKIAARSVQLLNEVGLPHIGGSDTHCEDDIAKGGTEFFQMPNHFEDIRQLILSDQCRPFKPAISTRIKRWLKGD